MEESSKILLSDPLFWCLDREHKDEEQKSTDRKWPRLSLSHRTCAQRSVWRAVHALRMARRWPGVSKGRAAAELESSLRAYSRMCQQSTSGRNTSEEGREKSQRGTFKPKQAGWQPLGTTESKFWLRSCSQFSPLTTSNCAKNHMGWFSFPFFFFWVSGRSLGLLIYY